MPIEQSERHFACRGPAAAISKRVSHRFLATVISIKLRQKALHGICLPIVTLYVCRTIWHRACDRSSVSTTIENTYICIYTYIFYILGRFFYICEQINNDVLCLFTYNSYNSKLTCSVLCLKIMPNGAVARDGRLCLGQRILEVC